MFSLFVYYLFLVLRIKNRLRIACNMFIMYIYIFYIYFLTVFQKRNVLWFSSYSSTLQSSPDIWGLLCVVFFLVLNLIFC